MNTDLFSRLQRINTLLEQAGQLDEGRRISFLVAVCREDATLQQEVEQLLKASIEETGDRLLERLQENLDRLAFAMVSEKESLVNQTIGPYQIQGVIGQGGMATVYRARRADLENVVALKLMGGRLHAPHQKARFLREQRFLAHLEHPNIARLMDAGTTDLGQPFFVMEYVEGRPIDVYCEEEGLSVEQRLHLFEDVCAAVRYAHQNLIVHRDLKPGNILVRSDATVKLLDFGIGKLLATDEPETSSRHTSRLMTPAYAAPEQVQDKPISTATDIYSLGVLLYQLLSGRMPYEIGELTPTALERVVCEVVPPDPSVAALSSTKPDAKQIHKQLTGDLDRICQKALRKEPSQRYESVQQFAEDIRRRLDGLPIIAQQSTWGYRTRKFIGRHRLGFAAAVLILCSLIAGLLGTLWQAQVAAQERDQAQLEAEKAEQVKNFLSELFRIPDRQFGDGAQADTLRAISLLSRGVDRIDHELESQPEIRAEILTTLGGVYTSMGLYEQADSLISKAVEVARKQLDKDSPTLARALNSLGILYQAQNRYDEANRTHREALSIRRRIYGEKHETVAESWDSLAVILDYQGSFEVAYDAYSKALSLRIELLGEVDPRVALVYSNLSTMRFYESKFNEAIAYGEKALDILIQTDSTNNHVSTAYTNLGVAYQRLGRYEDAISLFLRALSTDSLLFGSEHPTIAVRYNNLATSLEGLSRFEEAECYHKKALEIRLRAFQRPHIDLGDSYNNLGGYCMKSYMSMKRHWSCTKRHWQSAKHYLKDSHIIQ